MLMLFPMELSDQSDSSETEDDEKLTESHPGSPSKHLHSSHLSNSDMGDEPCFQLITLSPFVLVLVLLALDFTFVFVPVGSNTCIQQL